jgi:hypothetical protein
LIYACDADAKEHTAAQNWWAGVLRGPEEIGLAWIVILGFLRITTRRGLAARPFPVATAMGLIRNWIAAPRVEILTPGSNHANILFELIEQAGTAGNLTTDAHLAALAIEYRAQIASTDNDFARFARLRWFNPIGVN